MSEPIKGFKVFNPDWTCRDKQYTCPGKFEEDVTPKVCNRGIHFCKRACDCFRYYGFNSNNHVAEVIAYGDVAEGDDKCCTNKLEIVRELTWYEVLDIVNTGKDCTGCGNSGNYNSGSYNSGSYNSGSYNSGNRNSGSYNSGNNNSGNNNSGNRNSGNRNSGDYNSGDYNSGDYNSGDYNSGDYNSGHFNSGNRNSGNRNNGDYNSGNRNSGHFNSGDYNSGDYNSGHFNSGSRNSGDWNKTNYSNGCFNTDVPRIYLFNKPSEWTYLDWLRSVARTLLAQLPTSPEYVKLEDMTDAEKREHPEAETMGGYLKEFDTTARRNEWWRSLSDSDKDVITSIPNFDKDIFKEITGIDIDD